MLRQVSIIAAVTALGVVSAQAADLSARVYTKAPVMMVAPYNWTGFYLGVNAGYGLARNQTAYDRVLGGTQFHAQSYLGPRGAIGGGQLGYNWQSGNWVLGLETDIQASGMRENTYCGFQCTTLIGTVLNYDQKLNWFGTTRARLGLATGPVLSYVTGGFAYGGVQTDVSGIFFPAPGSQSIKETRTGWTYGSGVEASLGGNWTGKVEYLYLNLGTQRFAPPPAIAGANNGGTDIREHIFRAGVNYRIGGNAAYVPPPVANWSGFYLGVNAGSALARNASAFTFTAPALTETWNTMPAGYIGGVQGGYNWQSANWVLGIEADFQGSTQRDNKNCNFACTANQAVSVDQRITSLGTVRGRLGYSVGPTLFYGTAGWAHGTVRTNITGLSGPGNTYALDVRHSKGGWTAGGGMETPFELFGLFGKNWTAKTEYLYVDLGTIGVGPWTAGPFTHTFTSRIQEHIFRGGINYHFNTPVMAKY